MARPLRVQFPGATYHGIARGLVARRLFTDDLDCYGFLVLFARAVKRFDWVCHAFCLMTTHYHLALETNDANLSRGMHWLNTCYAQRFNARHGSRGHVFDGRFKAVVVERDSHLLELARYVALNPVRARLCRQPEDWPWSSYAATAGLAPHPSFLTSDVLLDQFANDRADAQLAFRQFVAAGIRPPVWTELNGELYLPSESVVPFGHVPGSG
jgi:REP element-mobilizing transposase RayT